MIEGKETKPALKYQFGAPGTLLPFYEHQPIAPQDLARHLRDALAMLTSYPEGHLYRDRGMEEVIRLALLKKVPLENIGLQPPEYHI